MVHAPGVRSSAWVRNGRFRCAVALAAVLILFSLATLIHAAQGNRLDSWEVLGPGGGGSMFHPTVSPHDPNTVMVASDMSGAFLTRDGGSTWLMFNLRGPVQFFAFSAHNSSVLYAKSAALYRSRDAGVTWELAYPPPQAIAKITRTDDHAEETYHSAAGPFPDMVAMALDPQQSSSMYAVFEGDRRTLAYSSDEGATWREWATLSRPVRQILVGAPASTDAGTDNSATLYLIGAQGTGIFQHGKLAWRSRPAGISEFLSMSAGLARGAAEPLVYGLTSSALFVSRDGGSQWQAAALTGSGHELLAVGASSTNPEVAYVSVNAFRYWFRQWFGVLMTKDGGRSWSVSWRANRSTADNLRDAWMDARFGPGWTGNPWAFGIAPNRPEICYATDTGRTLRTVDGGRTWESLYSNAEPDGSWRSRGLDVTTTYGVHFDPFEPQRVLLSTTDIGLFSSNNYGRSWKSATTGISGPWLNTTYWVEFDPQVRGRAWAAMSGIHDLPRPKVWNRTQPKDFTGGVAITADGGRTWSKSNHGMPESAITHILLDPRSSREARILYAAAFGRGVFKSVDGGRNWILLRQGMSGDEPFIWRLALDSAGTLYAVAVRRSDPHRRNPAVEGALYRSDDGGESWRPVPLPAPVTGPTGLAIDPKDPGRLYLAVWGRSHPDDGPAAGGIYLSTNQGTHWKRVLDRDDHIYDITIDPRDSRILYACGFESSVWKSRDRGATWQRLRGFNFKWGHRVVVDPRRADQIWVTTFGGSVWRGPADGDPRSTDDILTPPLRLW
jgi:photosystem II stability/assembly factor-like uncharacterized protein